MDTIKYLQEPVLNSELVLVNNAKLLKSQPDLLNETHLDEIDKLRQDYIDLETQSDVGITGLQKEKRKIRDEIRELSVKTYTLRDTNMFGNMITMIVNRIASRPQFSNYTYIDEMKSLAVEHILLYTYRFDPYRQSKISGQYASAFAYISTIAFHAFIATINKWNKEQEKSKEQFLEKQKLIHREPNTSTYGPDYEDTKRSIHFPNLKSKNLLSEMKKITISEPIDFWIPLGYKISEQEYNYIIKYEYNISIRRINATT